MRVALTADHNAVALRDHVAGWLAGFGHEIAVRGAVDETVLDYPALCLELGQEVVAGGADLGIVLGGSGSGEQMAANKVRGVRAALCHCTFTAQIARAHNDANVLVMGAKVVAPALAERIVSVWLETEFKGGRHQERVEAIMAIEAGRGAL